MKEAIKDYLARLMGYSIGTHQAQMPHGSQKTVTVKRYYKNGWPHQLDFHSWEDIAEAFRVMNLRVMPVSKWEAIKQLDEMVTYKKTKEVKNEH